MGRALPHLIALLLGVAAALAIGCGDRSNLVPDDAASELNGQLAAVKAAVDAGDCPAAKAAVDRASARYQALPASVDDRLKRRIGEGIRALRRTAPEDCLAAQTQTQPTDTTPTETQTTPTEQQTTPTEQQTTPSETTPSDTTPPDTTTTDTTTTDTTATTPNGGTSGEVPTP